MRNTCPNMGYSYETAQTQHRPSRSDRIQPSNEPYTYYDHEQRFHSSDKHFVSQQPHPAEATHSNGFVRASRSLKQPPIVLQEEEEDERSRTQGPDQRPDQDVHEPEVKLPVSFQRRTVAVLEQYSAIVLDTLSQLINRHVASDKRLRDGLRTGPQPSGNDSMTDDKVPTLTPSSSGSTSNEPHRRPPSSRTCGPDALLTSLHEMASCGRSQVSCPAPSVSQRAPSSSSSPPWPSPSTPVTKSTSSHHLVRHSLCLYAASSVLLALCYLTIPTVASDTAHPIRGKVRFAEGKSDKEILDHLLKNSRYDKRLLPPVDDADFCCGMHTPEMAKHIPDMRVPGRPQNRGTLTVNVSVLLLSLASPDESSLKYEVEFLLQQQWFDPRLRYANQSQYEYLNAIHHHEDIWLPDTYFIMHGDFKDPIIPMHFALRIYRNGTINYLMRRHLILSCQGRLNIFPFDDPLCSFALESISYEQSAITYVWKNDEDTLRKSPSLTTLNAYLIQNQTIACPIKASWRAEGQTLSVEDEEFLCNLCQRRFEEQGNYSCLKVDLIFTRDRAFYFTTVFIPGIILVTSSFITFWLEWNAVPARSMIGVTTMLNFFTTSNGFRSTLPVVSNLTAMNVWDGVCMCFIYASLLEFVCVNYVGRKRPLHNVVYRPGENPVTQRLPAVLSRIGIILASPLPKRESGGPNEIVACTSCAGGTSPCTHSANNGCATETCFVQVRKKEPPHPIRVAKTIDVIARITFPSAYAVFLIFFFIHYKGFS
ncbi:glutamate-gated chloride channel-like isoform X2 [Anopheles albimanus]|uniref:glutamate-gated chloride channel-like isoform X2 n=1 Tax=Anopheles albimanus TaxID=7167 RepID=UPI00163F4809|nr:glutamate-gated chloride channel-like isoform X2 [Anopheles albimanus]